MAQKDVLLMLVAADRDTAWEDGLLSKCPVPGQLEIRWINPSGPDGVYRKPFELDSSIFNDVTMLYTYFPAPDGKSGVHPMEVQARPRAGPLLALPLHDADCRHSEYVPKLRFVQLSSAGSDMWADHPKYLNEKVVFCTTSGSNT